MEPAVDRREDSTRWCRTSDSDIAAMEPAVDRREDVNVLSNYVIPPEKLQWSPPLIGGKTAREKRGIWAANIQACASTCLRLGAGYPLWSCQGAENGS